MPKERIVPLGELVATPGALESIDNFSMMSMVYRHMHGDWSGL